MDKQMIEEMAKNYCINRYRCNKDCVVQKTEVCKVYETCELLYKLGYRKIPKGAVVLTMEEYKKLKHGSGTLEQLYNQYPYRVLVGFNSMVFSQDRESYERLYDEIEKKARKETAEKFAERLKEKLNEWLEDNEDLNGKIDFGIAEIELIGVKSLDGEIISESLIDEICKEFTGEN